MYMTSKTIMNCITSTWTIWKSTGRIHCNPYQSCEKNGKKTLSMHYIIKLILFHYLHLLISLLSSCFVRLGTKHIPPLPPRRQGLTLSMHYIIKLILFHYLHLSISLLSSCFVACSHYCLFLLHDLILNHHAMKIKLLLLF